MYFNTEGKKTHMTYMNRLRDVFVHYSYYYNKIFGFLLDLCVENDEGCF